MRLTATPLPLLALVVVLACSPAPPPTGASGGSSAPDPPGTSAPQAGEAFATRLTGMSEAAAPVEGQLSFDRGVTVTATGPDGTVFRLVAPPHAVLVDTTVRLTPLTGVEGAGPGPVHAVRLEPEGLLFEAPVELTIEPATQIAIDDQVLFHATGSGDELGAALVDPASEPITLVLQHFSIAGVAVARAQAAWLQDRSMGALRRIAHESGRYLQAERARQLGGAAADPGFLDRLRELFDQADRDVLTGMREAALLTCDATAAYVGALRHLEYQRQRVGISDDDTAATTDAEITRATEASYDVCEREAIDRCTAARDPAILLAFWLSWDRQRTLRDLDPTATPPDATERAERTCRPDYRVRKTVTVTELQVTASVVYEGVKCDTPVGDWTIISVGKLSGHGGTAQLKGTITATISESMSGTLTGRDDFSGPTGETYGEFSGTASYDEEARMLELRVLEGSGNGYPYGFLDTGFTSPGTLSLPVEVGAFCDA